MADRERNLLRLLTDDEGFQTAIFLTYGVDLAFFEEALLSTLRSQNCRSHVIFVDATRYEDTLKNLRGSFSWVGSRYVLVPVSLPHGLFHPKIALLVGPDRGRLLVGSGNLTFSGYGSNQELFTSLDWSPETDSYQSLFADVWRFVRALCARFCTQQAAELILAKAERRASWLSSSGSEPLPLHFLHNLDQPLLVQMSAVLEERQVLSATILAPFFSPTQLHAVANAVHAEKTMYVVQPGRVVGDQDGLARLLREKDSISLACFLDERRYIHAKAYVFETDAGAIAVTGSPNCSAAALSAIAESGNIEAAILAHHPEPAHYATLLADAIEPIDSEDVGALSFGESPPPVRPQRRLLILLDTAISGNLVTLRFRVLGEFNGPLLLTARFVDDETFVLRLGEFAKGEHTATVEVDDGFLSTKTGPISVYLQHDQGGDDSTPIDSNELWLARLDVLRSEATRALVGARPAAEALLGLGNDEERWQALYEVLSQLLSDELARISRHSPSLRTRVATREKGTEQDTDGPTEDEVVVIEVEEATEDEETARRLEEELEEESEFGDFLNIVLGLMPGHGPKEDSGAGGQSSDTEKHKRKPWTIEQRIRRRLVGVLRKYIDSLGNAKYLPNLPATAAARGLVVFLLFTRRLHLAGVFDWNEYAAVLTELLTAFYGAPLSSPPIHSALHERVLLSDGAGVWREKHAPYYVLAALFTLAGRDTSFSGPPLDCTVRSLVGLAAMCGDLNTLVHDVKSLESTAEHMDLDATRFVVGVEEMVVQARPYVIETLEAWLSRAAYDPTVHDDSPATADPLASYQRKRHRYQANIDYRNALFFLYCDEEGILQRRLDLCEELSFWCRLGGKNDIASKWDEQLVALAEAEGDVTQLADALYEQGKQLFFQHEYQQAVKLLRQAKTLAISTGNVVLAERCVRYMDNAMYFLR